MALIRSLMLFIIFLSVIIVCNGDSDCKLVETWCYTNNTYGHETKEYCNYHGKPQWCTCYNKFHYVGKCRVYDGGGCDVVTGQPGKKLCPDSLPNKHCINYTSAVNVNYTVCCCVTTLCNDDGMYPYPPTTTSTTSTTTTITTTTKPPPGVQRCQKFRYGKPSYSETCLSCTNNCVNEYRGRNSQTIVNSGCDCHNHCKGLGENNCTWKAEDEAWYCCCNWTNICNSQEFKPPYHPTTTTPTTTTPTTTTPTTTTPTTTTPTTTTPTTTRPTTTTPTTTTPTTTRPTTTTPTTTTPTTTRPTTTTPTTTAPTTTRPTTTTESTKGTTTEMPTTETTPTTTTPTTTTPTTTRPTTTTESTKGTTTGIPTSETSKGSTTEMTNNMTTSPSAGAAELKITMVMMMVMCLVMINNMK